MAKSTLLFKKKWNLRNYCCQNWGAFEKFSVNLKKNMSKLNLKYLKGNFEEINRKLLSKILELRLTPLGFLGLDLWNRNLKITNSFKHWDRVQLHGFLDLKPFPGSAGVGVMCLVGDLVVARSGILGPLSWLSWLIFEWSFVLTSSLALTGFVSNSPLICKENRN